MRWARVVPALAGWAAVATVVGAVVAVAPSTSRAVDVVLTDPPPHRSSPQWTPTSTMTTTTTTTAVTVAPTRTDPPTTTRQPDAITNQTTTGTTETTTDPTTGTTTTATTTTEPPACSSPDRDGPIQAEFRQPCTGSEVIRYPVVQVFVPHLPDTGGVGIVLHTMTDEHGNEQEDYDFRAGAVHSPGLWEDTVQVGVLCEEDRTRAELRVYLFSADGWNQFIDPGRPSWEAITLPPDSRLLDHVAITRTGQPSGPDCEEK